MGASQVQSRAVGIGEGELMDEAVGAREILGAVVQAMGAQAIAVGGVADQVAALKRTLARQFPDMADELKGQIEAEQDKHRTDVYELQVSLGKLREAIAQLPEGEGANGDRPTGKAGKSKAVSKAKAKTKADSLRK